MRERKREEKRERESKTKDPKLKKKKKRLTSLQSVELGLATSEQLYSWHANDGWPVTMSASGSQ